MKLIIVGEASSVRNSWAGRDRGQKGVRPDPSSGGRGGWAGEVGVSISRRVGPGLLPHSLALLTSQKLK